MTEKFRVVVADYVAEAPIELEILGDIATIDCLQARIDDEVATKGAGAAAIIVFHDILLTNKCFDRMPQLKGVVRVGVGYDNVDLRAAGRQGIVVCNVPDYGTEDVADHALMSLLAIARRLIPTYESVRAGAWDPSIAFGSPRLRGRTLGIIGLGRIGTAMALRAKAVGLDVVFYDPYVAPGIEKSLGLARAWRLEELLPRCHFVTLHCPHTVETRHILNRKTLALLPKGAYIVNTARGPCVDADSLLEALESGQVTGAALDVVEREPLDDERLRRHPRVLLTPHTAFYSAEGFIEMRTKAAQEIHRILTGEEVRNPVNLHLLDKPRAKVPSRDPDRILAM